MPKLASGMFIRAKNDTTYLTGGTDQMISGNFAINDSFQSYGTVCLPTASYSNTAVVFCATFRRQSFLKLFKKANCRLKTTWNTTQGTSFSLVSVFCQQIFRILPITHISVACTLFRFVHAWCRGLCTLVDSL